METSGNGRVLHRGKNTGGAWETGHVNNKLRGKAPCPASRLLLPWRAAFFEMARLQKQGVATGRCVLPFSP